MAKTKRTMCRGCGKMIREGHTMVEVGWMGVFRPFHFDCGVAYHHRMADLEVAREMQLALHLELQAKHRRKEKQA